MSKVISVSAQKGGCGKSSVTIIFASMLAYNYNKRVLVVDADTNQHSIQKTRLVDIQTITPYNTGEIDENGKERKSVKNWYVYEAYTQLQKRGIKAYDIAVANLDAEEIVNILNSKSDDYDFILLDLPGNVDNVNYFKVVRLSDIIFVPFVVDPMDFDSNYPFAKVLHDKFLGTTHSRIKQMYYFWNKFNPNVRKSMFEEMEEILQKNLPNAVEMRNKINDSGAMTNAKCRNTLCAPIGEYGSHGNIGVTVKEMCEIVGCCCCE